MQKLIIFWHLTVIPTSGGRERLIYFGLFSLNVASKICLCVNGIVVIMEFHSDIKFTYSIPFNIAINECMRAYKRYKNGEMKRKKKEKVIIKVVTRIKERKKNG